MKKIVLLMFLVLSANIWANLVEDGIQTAKKGNHTQAFKMFQKACDEQKNALGCKYTAEAYNKAIVVKSDMKKALSYYTKACKFGLGESCLFIANSYHKGTGIKKDNLKALEFYDAACNEKIAKACFNYGFIYEIGQGVPRDVKKAKAYYKKSCDMGGEKACGYYKQLGSMGI